MEKFPQLKNEQVALLKADINTGIVLDENYEYVTKVNQKVYTVFDNLDFAIKFAKDIIKKRSDVECGIYGKDPVAILILSRNNIGLY